MLSKDALGAVAPESSILAAIRAEAKRNKKSTLTMRRIDREIAAFRRANVEAPPRRPTPSSART